VKARNNIPSLPSPWGRVKRLYLTTEKKEDFDVETADVNNDGSITMADANAIVNMFLGGEK
jgi:hypothetical protein